MDISIQKEFGNCIRCFRKSLGLSQEISKLEWTGHITLQ